MAEASGGEFWREFKPVAQVFRPGAMPEVYIANAATDDERFYAPLSETVGTRPLWISPSCLLYTSPSPRDGLLSRMPSSA